MAVIVPKIHDTKFSDVNGYYRVEDFNLPPDYNSSSVSQYCNGAVQFANAGNVLGAILSTHLYSGACNGTYPLGGLCCGIASGIQTFTADAGTDTFTTPLAHGYNNGDMVTLWATAGGALPGGLLYNPCVYFVINAAPTTFKVSLTSGGVAINISTNGSGTLECAVLETWKKLTADNIFGAHTAGTNRNWTDILPVFEFDTFRTGTSYAVTTDANKYWIVAFIHSARFGGIDDAGTTFLLRMSGNTSVSLTKNNMVFGVWCDNQVSLNDDDSLIVTKHTIIDQSKALKTAGVPDGQTTIPMACLIICYDPSNTYEYLLDTEEIVAASYNLSLEGTALCATAGGWRIGRSDHPVPSLTRFNILNKYGTLAIRTMFASSHYHGVGQGYGYVTPRFAFYGEYPTKTYTQLVNNEIATSTELEVTDDMTSHWAAGDKIVVSKINLATNYDTATYTIQSVASNKITLTGGLSKARASGGYVLKIAEFNFLSEHLD